VSVPCTAKSLRHSRTLLVLHSTLTVRALRGVATLSTIHRVRATILWYAVDLLRLGVLARLASGWLVPNGRQLRSAHLRCHHMLLAILSRLAWRLAGVAVSCRLRALAFLFLFALILFLLLLGFPFLADLLELYETSVSMCICRADPRGWKVSAR
jgi:hypothetical protein